jgi:hypothetical protein
MKPARVKSKNPRASPEDFYQRQRKQTMIAMPSSICRSLLAGDAGLNRLQAGSYIPIKSKRASRYLTQSG